MIKDLLKKRVFILGSIFVLLLVYWYMTVPIKVKDCSIGNIEYAHKGLNMCSDKIIYYEPYDMRILTSKIISNNDPDKYYTRNNIAGHIAYIRQSMYNNTSYWDNIYADYGYIRLLSILGHYDEAEDYLKSFTNRHYENYSAIYTVAKEKCYNFDRRAFILGCRAITPVTTLYAKHEINRQNKEDSKYFNKLRQHLIYNYKNGKIRFPKFGRTYENIHNILDAINNGQYNLAEKYIKNYTLTKEHTNSMTINLYYKLGLTYMNKGYYGKAIPCFEKILAIRDYDYKAHEKLEICYRKLGKTQKADEHARIMKELMAL